jgi:hypothetical protein
MLPLEVIGVLGVLYIFFTVGALRAVLAKRAVRRQTTAEAKPTAA